MVNNSSEKPNTKSNHSTKNTPSSSQLQPCIVCNGKHGLYGCPTFLQMDTYSRYEKVRDATICINCLKTKEHGCTTCTSRGCRICDQKHHTLLHFPNKSTENDSSRTNKSETEPKPSTSRDAQNFHSNLKTVNQVLLSTAVIFVLDHRDKYVECRALLDNASTANYVTDEFASRLKLPRQSTSISCHGINQTKTEISQRIRVHIKSRNSKYETDLLFNIVNEISSALPQCSFNVSLWDIPKKVPLADSSFNVARPVDMLIGGEKFFELIQVGKISLGPNKPSLQSSVFGWLCVGSSTKECHLTMSYSENQKENQNYLNSSLKQLFEIDQVPEKIHLSKDE